MYLEWTTGAWVGGIVRWLSVNMARADTQHVPSWASGPLPRGERSSTGLLCGQKCVAPSAHVSSATPCTSVPHSTWNDLQLGGGGTCSRRASKHQNDRERGSLPRAVRRAREERDSRECMRRQRVRHGWALLTRSRYGNDRRIKPHLKQDNTSNHNSPPRPRPLRLFTTGVTAASMPHCRRL